MGRALERAAAALDAKADLQRLERFGVVLLIGALDLHGHEVHRAMVDAAAAADARRGRHGRASFSLNTRMALVPLRRGVQIVLGNAHHRAAHDKLLRLAAKAAGKVDNFLAGRADGSDDVLRLLDGGTVNGDALFHERGMPVVQ